jgi:hypothetical protein
LSATEGRYRRAERAASGGDIDISGGDGSNGNRLSFPGVSASRAIPNAFGGAGHLGKSQRSPDVGNGGAAGISYGGGGTGGALNASTAGKAGGDGAAGIVIVTEYYLG